MSSSLPLLVFFRGRGQPAELAFSCSRPRPAAHVVCLPWVLRAAELAPGRREYEPAGRSATGRQDCSHGESAEGRREGHACRPVLARSLKMFCSCLAAAVLEGVGWRLPEGSLFPPSPC